MKTHFKKERVRLDNFCHLSKQHCEIWQAKDNFGDMKWYAKHQQCKLINLWEGSWNQVKKV
jgi:hypothetical protein